MTDALAAHLAAARAAWPSLAWHDEDYVAWLVALAGDELEVRLARAEPGDVVLCWAAGRGDPEAHRLLDARFIGQLAPVLRKFDASAAFVDEVAQRVRVKLLVPRPGAREAPIAGYALRGSLLGLVRVAAVREAISLRRGDKPQAPAEALDELAGELDPVQRHLKLRYGAEFERAFAAAVAELPARDRRLLRMSMSLGASIDDIARVFDTHRATAARWLNAARDALAANTRRHLAANLGLPDDQLASLLRLVRTQAARLLDSIPPGDDEG